MAVLLVRHLHWLFSIAIALDLAIIFGPPLFDSGNWVVSYLLLAMRWLVMGFAMLGLYKAHQSSHFSTKELGWISIYFIFGFTAAGAANGFVNTVS